MGDEFSLEDALIVLRRRALFFLIPAVDLTILGVGVVMLLPSKYTAQGSILIESAQIPSDLVRSTINSYAQERIEVIKQRVMTRDKLLQIADKYGIFPKKQALSPSKRVQKMRDRLKITPMTSEGMRTSAQRDGTIYFTVSYTDPSPDKAFQVANEFMSLFLTEDARTRTASASNTTEFFNQETARLAAEVAGIEGKISEFKSANSTALPEYLQMHMEMLERSTDELSATQSGVMAIEEEIRFIETQLTGFYAGATGDGGPSQEISRLKTELAQLRSVYRDAHPNVKAVRDQIRSLESQMAPSKEILDLQAALKSAEIDLKSARQALAAGDPVLAEKKAAVAAAQDALSEKVAREAASETGNLMSSQLQGRMSVAQSRRELLLAQIEDLKLSIADLKGRIEKTPEVDRGLSAILRTHENVYKEYQDVLAKQQEAQLAENLEDNQKAEKFSILEAADRPEKPSSPERVKLSVLALFMALGGGVAAAGGAEFLTMTIRGRSHLAKIIGADPIAVIPNFEREKPAGFKFGARRAQPAALAAAAIAALSREPAVSPNDALTG